MVGNAIAHFLGNCFHIRLQEQICPGFQESSKVCNQLWLHNSPLLVPPLEPGVRKLNGYTLQRPRTKQGRQ